MSDLEIINIISNKGIELIEYSYDEFDSHKCKNGYVLKNNKLIVLLITDCELTINLVSLIFKCKELEELYLQRNNMLKIPRSISNLRKLSRLHLGSNQIKEIPQSICDLNKLQILSMYNNNIDEIPMDIIKLEHLKELNLKNNNIQTIPSNIASLITLEKVLLQKNNIKEIPNNFHLLENLKELDLNANNIVTISKGIINLKNLEKLDLNSNNILSFPTELFNLKKLRKLSLNRNEIVIIPDSISQLENIMTLNLNGNKINKISSKISFLKNLKILKLTHNSLLNIPKEIFEITSLKDLYLTGNKITKISKDIQKLNNLKRLVLSNNRINFVDKNILKLQNLRKISLNGNPIIQNLNELKNLNAQELISYLLSIQDKESKPLNEAKILVLGDERVGKTSIINRIVGNNFESNQISTQGIDIQNHYLSDDIKVNIWDFAGQEITHQTHQFFLSTRSLYLFVLDAQKEDNDSAIYDWLEVIKSNGGDSPIIIVANKYDLNRGYSFDTNRYKKDFPNIIDIVNVSAQENININILIESVEKHISELDHVKDVLPKDWLEVKKTLEQLSNEEADYIEGGKFDEICEENNIDEELDQQTLLTILHEIGTIVRYENSKLNSVQIINPLWVTNAVYKIIRSEFLNEDAILHKDTFSEIFKDDKRYRERHYQWIMDLLVQFELAFRLDENRILIPSKLPNNEPGFDITPFQQGLNLRYKYEGRLKKSFISQFMVKMSDEIDMSLEIPYWQRGVFLKYGNCNAVVISEEEKKTITVSIDTENIQGREFLSNIRREFKKINKSIEVEEEVPLILDEQIVGFADYENLVWAEEEGDTHFRFKVKVDGESKSHRFKISDLLYGYEMLDESEVVDTRPLIITEGKTDWKHLKKALERFNKDGLYKDLDIKFEEFENMEMGDKELMKMFETYPKIQQPRKTIFLFDRDDVQFVKKYGKDSFNSHGNNVYSFCIPEISDELDTICIEFFYTKNDLKTIDKNGRRLFIGNEFFDNGNSKCGNFQAKTCRKKGRKSELTLIDSYVYKSTDKEWKHSIALSKNDFAENIKENKEGFDNFDIEYFKLIFDVIEKIVNEK